MRTLVCSRCNRTQTSGKFCLDCGGPITEKVTIGISFKPILNCTRSADALKSDVRKWLARIGVQQTDIQIVNDRDQASVEYKLLGQSFHLKSHLQRNFQYNLAAIEQLLHYRVLGIERGIETREQAFKAYEALPAPEAVKPSGYDALSEDELKQLLKTHHPDTGGGDTDKFQQIKAALDRKRKK